MTLVVPSKMPGAADISTAPGIIDGYLGAAAMQTAGSDYFTAPAVRPATKFFCSSRNPITIGMETTTDAAII